MKKLIKKAIGSDNVVYLRSFFLSKKEKDLLLKRKLFYSQFLKKGDLYFDVGANYGNRIQPVIDIGLKIIAIEPQSKCINYLKKRYGNKITIVPKGLGSKEEVKTMFISNTSTISSFSQDWITSTKESGRFNQYEWNEERQIDMTTLDNLIDEFGLPRFIKIDVEGYELEVLKGLTKPVQMISFEYTVPEQTDRAIQCLQRIMDITGNHITCNYSIAERMEWALKEWLTPEQMLLELKSERFIKSGGFGDMYVNYCP